MAKRSIGYDQSEFQFEYDGLNIELEKARSNIGEFKRRHFNRVREETLVYILGLTADLAEGCLVVANAHLPASSAWTSRGLLEYLFWASWVMLSDENAKKFQARARNEGKRQVKKTLRKGFGKVIDKKTGSDKTREFLDSDEAKDIGKKIDISQCARDTGLERIYDIYYSYLATAAHGGLYGFERAKDKKENALANLAIANLSMQCVNLVVGNWMTNRKLTPSAGILDMWR